MVLFNKSSNQFKKILRAGNDILPVSGLFHLPVNVTYSYLGDMILCFLGHAVNNGSKPVVAYVSNSSVAGELTGLRELKVNTAYGFYFFIMVKVR